MLLKILLFILLLRAFKGINIMLPFEIIIYVLHNAARRNIRMDIYSLTTFGPSTLEAANVNLEEEYSLIYKRPCNLTRSIESLAFSSLQAILFFESFTVPYIIVRYTNILS